MAKEVENYLTIKNKNKLLKEELNDLNAQNFVSQVNFNFVKKNY